MSSCERKCGWAGVKISRPGHNGRVCRGQGSCVTPETLQHMLPSLTGGLSPRRAQLPFSTSPQLHCQMHASIFGLAVKSSRDKQRRNKSSLKAAHEGQAKVSPLDTKMSKKGPV
ncbi:hypothetical protein E2C01_047595 [Portunus trituberculatus]|uniref:Uncharacterized protein n=1 Tax=Portunus trituberculatus TaxID=210409 RepID=A0A5B7G807_PORTR|nr:hypothetical protein [Portunus trituberculatus]